MQIFYFDPIYTSKEMLIAMKKVLKVNYVFSLMRVEDLNDDLLYLHKTEFVTKWEPSTLENFNNAFKVVARQIVSIISHPVYKDGILLGYSGEANIVYKNRPIYTLVTKDKHYPKDSNILILRRRSYYQSIVICPQSPSGAIISYVRKCLQNQDVNNVSEKSRFFKSKNGTVALLENVSTITIPSSFDKVRTYNNEMVSYDYNPFNRDYWDREDLKIQYDISFLLKKNITPPEYLILNENKIADYLKGKQISSASTRLNKFLFSSYLIFLLSRELCVIPEKIIEQYMTIDGRKKYLNEESQVEQEWKKEEEEAMRKARSEYEERCYEDNLKSEIDYIRNNGGDWMVV
jgi:hypothetical protein